MNLQLRFVFLFFLLFVSTLISCKKEVLQTDSKKITGFKFETSLNSDFLLRDVDADIHNFEIKVRLPSKINRSELIATFSFEGQRVLVNNQEQKSAITANDFKEPLSYIVEALDGSKQQYTVIIEEIEDAGLLFNNFSFETKNNPGLKEASKKIRRGDSIFVRVKGDVQALIASFDTEAIDVRVNGMAQNSGQSVLDFSEPLVYTLTSSFGLKKEFTIIAERSSGIPHVYIETEGRSPITSKETYLRAGIRIEGEEIYDDYIGTTGIRGRGNSTWLHPKKPYRLKLDEKVSLFGLEAAKDWVLLSNYIDESLMLNAVAMKMGQLMGMPYTNTMIPVDLTVNGEYFGNYMLTEQVEVKKGRVDLDEDGYLLELDSYFDEDYRFRSNMYGLPVMMKYPKSPSTEQFDKIKREFRVLENALHSSSFPNNNYLDFIDKDALVDYLIVYNFTLNQEINHPKSTFMYKQNSNGKYKMGPIWDFDWAFSYDRNKTHFISTTEPLMVTNPKLPGTSFFQRFLEDPGIKTLYQKKWKAFKQNKLPELLMYVDDYSNLITESFHQDYKVWAHGSEDFSNTVQNFKAWLLGRAEYMDDYVRFD